MQPITYNLKEDLPINDFFIIDQALVINCAGVTSIDTAFTTYLQNGRKDFYLQYIIKGNLFVTVDDKKYTMTPGQIIVYYPNTKYKYFIEKNEKIEYLWLHFTGYESVGLIDKCKFLNREIVTVGLNEDIILKFKSIFNEFITRDYLYIEALQIKLFDLLFSLARLRDSLDLKNTLSNEIYKSILYINDNYTNDIKISTLADLTHFSQSYYRKMFKEYTNQSPREYITKMRINNSASLLLKTNLSIKEIAELSGYSDPLYFSRIFKSVMGLSPKMYKNESIKGGL